MGCDNSNVRDNSISYCERNICVNNEASHISRTSSVHVMQFQPYMQSKANPNFNFPEVEDEQYSGSGLKQMKGYISNISEEELLKKRKEFWETRIEGNKEIWAFLHRICEEPEFKEQDVTEYLKAMEIVPYANCINVTYDSLGHLYEIPNYCINMPLKYELPGDLKNKPTNDKEIVITVRKGGDVKTFQVSVLKKVKQVKKFIGKNFNGIQSERIRLFYSGKEIDNNKELWEYNIDNNSNILMMVKD